MAGEIRVGHAVQGIKMCFIITLSLFLMIPVFPENLKEKVLPMAAELQKK